MVNQTETRLEQIIRLTLANADESCIAYVCGACLDNLSTDYVCNGLRGIALRNAETEDIRFKVMRKICIELMNEGRTAKEIRKRTGFAIASDKDLWKRYNRVRQSGKYTYPSWLHWWKYLQTGDMSELDW